MHIKMWIFDLFHQWTKQKVKTEQEFKKTKIKANAKLEQDMFDDERRKTKVGKNLRGITSQN